MPVFAFDYKHPQNKLKIWQIVEDVADLLPLLSETEDLTELQSISHPQKQKEWICSRILLKQLVTETGSTYYGTSKDEHGKPFLNELSAQISITNTFDYVAVIYNSTSRIGIDMELKQDKLIRTAGKFLSEPEQIHAGNDVGILAAYWCAKEALFKMNGRHNVSFRKAIQIAPFDSINQPLAGLVTDNDYKHPAEVNIFELGNYCLAIANELQSV